MLTSTIAMDELSETPYHALTITYDKIDITFEALDYYDEKIEIEKEEGSFTAQLISEEGTILFETGFDMELLVIPEPPASCFDSPISNCIIQPFEVSETLHTVYLPSLPEEHSIRILKENLLMLEVNLDDKKETEIEYLNVGCDEEDPDTNCDGELSNSETITFINDWLNTQENKKELWKYLT